VKKVAVFGNTGGGKSTLAKKLAELTHIPLYPLDTIQYRAGGGKVPHEEYLKAHSLSLQRDAWDRFAAADTLIYVDLPLFRHFWWVTKRFLKGVLVNPEGWPDRSPMINSTISSYRVLWLCHRHLTPNYRELVSTARARKRVYHLRSAAEMEQFLNRVELEARHA
jgi:adenylate kinase family enzyme